MDSRIENFLKKHRILALSTLLANGTPYVATCHFAFNEDGHVIILTEKTTKKCSGLDFSKMNPTAITVGFSEEEWIEFQATGKVTVITKESPLYDGFKRDYEKKFKTTLMLDESSVFLILKTADILNSNQIQKL